MADRRRLPGWARWASLACGLAVLGAGTYLVVGPPPSRATTSGLRTATVATGSVTQSISLSGSVERVDQVGAVFRTAGTVTSVRVGVGDEVAAGDVLATISSAGLQRAVTVAQANLVAAQAALDAAGSSSTSSGGTASAAPGSSGSSGTSGSSGSPGMSGTSGSSGSSGSTGSSSSATPTASPTPAPTGGSGQPTAPGPTVDTSRVHRALAGHDALVAAAVTTCQPLLEGSAGPGPNPTPTSSPSPSPSPSDTMAPSPTGSPTATPSPPANPSPTAIPSPTATPSASPSTGPSARDEARAAGTDATTEPASLTSPDGSGPTTEEVAACVQALSSALTSARHTASEMDRLATALDAAATALQEQRSNAGAQGTGSPGTTGTAGTGAGTTGGTGAGGGQAQGRSAASLAVDVLQATQELAAAEQDLDAAVLRAPISGTVGSVDLVKGEQAGTSSGVVVVGPGSAVVTVDLPLAQLGKVRVDQDVVVTPAGTTTALDGVVQSIGVLPSSTTSTTPTYPVRITVSDAPVTLATGSTATAMITVATATDVLTVPVSAVAGVSSGTGTVKVLADGTVTATRVTVGAVGAGRVQVEQGLSTGQVVVLADPTTALPSSRTGLRRSSTSGVSSLTGQSGPGAGMGGPPPGG